MTGERLVGAGLYLLGVFSGLAVAAVIVTPLLRWGLMLTILILSTVAFITGHARRGTLRR